MASIADQLPGCTIPDKRMIRTDQGLAHDTFCGRDLNCICKVDNHLGTNKLFSSDCVLKECTNGHGRKAFLRDWLESCREAGKTGWDKMPWEWEPYLPDEGEIVIRPSSFLNAPTVIASVRELPPSVVQVIITSTAGAVTSIELGSTSATSNHRTSKPSTTLSTPVTSMVNATVLSTNTTSTLTAFGSTPDAPASSPSTVVTSHKLSSGAIGGIVAGFLALAALCAALGYFYWKSDKKAERKTREVAILSDRVSGCGFQKYIDDLLADSNSDSHRDDNTSTGTIVRHPASTSGAQQMPVGSTSVVDGV